MAAVELFEKWTTGGPWEFTAPVSVDANGVLAVDASTHGVTSFYPCFGEAHYMFADSHRMSSNSRSMTKLYEFPVTFSTAGVVAVGFTVHPGLAASHHHKYEFSYDGAGVRFFAKGSTNFDNQTVIPGNKIRIRVAFSPTAQRTSVCSFDGTLISEDTSHTKHSLDLAFIVSYYETSNTAISMVAGPGTEDSSYGSNTLFLTVRSGSVLFDPTRIVTEVPEGSAYAVEYGTTATIRTKPATPSLGVVNYQNGLDKITMTSPDANTKIVASRNRGAFYSDAQSIVEDVLRLQCDAGATKAFSSTRPSVFRVIAHNGVPSDPVTVYVGPTTAVAIPEISVTRWSVSSTASSCVKMFCADATATIRYTVDGTEPTTSSLLYTEPLFVRSSAFIRAKSFKGADSSVTVNATFISSGLAIPNPYDTSLWVYNGNASFTASSLTVTDPTGIGVAFREDAYEQTSYDYYAGGYGTAGGSPFQYITSFNVSGPFRLKVPGTDKHIAWIGNAIGLVADTAATPTLSMGGAVSAKITITGNKYVAASYSCKNVVTVTGYDSGGTSVATATFNYETQPIDEYANVVSFTSEGISPFTVTNLSMSILSSATATLDTAIPLIDTVSARNVAGATAPAASTQGSGTLVTWDVDRSWPMEYRARLGWRIEDLQAAEMGYRTDNLLGEDKTIKVYYSGTAADTGAAWYTSKLCYGFYQVSQISTFNFGWSNVSMPATPAIRIRKARGVSTEMDVLGAVGGGPSISVVVADPDLGNVQSTALRGVKHDLMWRCGRKVVEGKLLVRTVLLDDGGDADYNPILNNIVYDTGWVDVGTAPAILPRPMFFVRGPMLSVSGDSEQRDLAQQYATIKGGLTEEQVESYMTFGSPASLPTPTLVVGAQASDGTYPVTATCAGATSIVVCAGSKPPQTGGGTAVNRWSVASGSSVSVPEISTVRAIGVGPDTSKYSAIATTYAGQDTADYISVTTRPGVALLRVLPRTKVYSPSVASIETIWSLWLNGVRFYELDLSTPGDVELNLEAGSYSVVLSRELRAGRNAGVVGTTQTPLTFIVPEMLDVSIVAPTTVVAGQNAVFTASSASTDVSWAWSFSDGSSSSTSTASIAFTKPGKYRWSLTAKTPLGDISQQSGTIIATFAPGLTIPTSRVAGTQERVS